VTDVAAAAVGVIFAGPVSPSLGQGGWGGGGGCQLQGLRKSEGNDGAS